MNINLEKTEHRGIVVLFVVLVAFAVLYFSGSGPADPSTRDVSETSGADASIGIF